MIAAESLSKDTLESPFVEAYERSRLTNGTVDSLAALREQALGHFLEAGFPPPKSEAWKYTNIRRKLSHPFDLTPASAPAETVGAAVEAASIDGLDAERIVLLNGRFVSDRSSLDSRTTEIVDLKEAVRVETFREHLGKYATPDRDSFVALNTAFAGEGVALHQKRTAGPARPVHIVNIVTGGDTMTQPRVLAVVDAGAELTVIETVHVLGEGASFVNSVLEGFVGAGGRVDYYRLQDGGDGLSAVTNAYFYQEESSHATCTTVTLSGDLIRNNVVMHPDGPHCESHLFGLFVGQGSLHVDNHTLVDHAKPDCFSNELYKGVLDDKSTGVFNGRVLVRRDAQKTNAYQSNKSIVLSDGATMNAKPELEIYADDVQCSHGATTGRLDAEALFYLRSRGLTERQARSMLLLAFVRDVLENIRPGALREYIDHLLEDRIGRRRHPAL